jgi:Xaa-Pro aminopeptidase
VVFAVILALVVVEGRLPASGGSPASQDVPLLLEQPRADYQARRRELMKQVKEDASRNRPGFGGSTRRVEPVIVLRGADDPDIEGKCRQSSDFAYLTGVDVPNAFLVLLPSQERATLYLPPPPRRGNMNSPRPVPGSATAESLGFDRVESTEYFLGDLFAALGDSLLPHGRSSAVLYTREVEARGFQQGPGARFTAFLKEGAPNTPVRDVAPIVAALRRRKSPAELALLCKAIAITGEAQTAVLKTIRPGIAEFQLEAKVMEAFTSGAALRAGFPSIIGSGPNSTIPHYFANDRTLQDGDLVVVDIGAEYKYYTADITRTYPASGTFSSRQREIYQLVLDAQKAVEAEIQVGKTRLRDMTQFTRDFFKKSPLRAKNDNGEEQTMEHFFIHGLGHYLGMDVHDVGSYEEPLTIGDVFTIEPGLYIKSENLGVRIEDDYLLTENGLEKLSREIASEPDAIERRIAEGRKRNAAP